MALSLFYNYPFISSNKIGRIDTATASANQTNFPLKSNTAGSVGAIIQADANTYARWLAGFSFPDNTDVTLSSAPAQGAQIVIPSQLGLNFEVFDQLSVPGQSYPANVTQTKFYLADDTTGPSNILNNTYKAVPGNPGIAIFFQNFATAAGASVIWTQLACAGANGQSLTYQASGTVLYTDNFQAYSNLMISSASSLSSTTIFINSATANGSFYPGDYIIINPGGANQENVPVTAVNYLTGGLTVTGLNFAHSSAELVFMNARGFWGQVTMPVGVLNGTATTLINCCPVVDCLVIARS